MYRSPAPQNVTKETSSVVKKVILIVGLVAAAVVGIFVLTLLVGGATALHQAREAPHPPTAASR